MDEGTVSYGSGHMSFSQKQAGNLAAADEQSV